MCFVHCPGRRATHIQNTIMFQLQPECAKPLYFSPEHWLMNVVRSTRHDKVHQLAASHCPSRNEWRICVCLHWVCLLIQISVFGPHPLVVTLAEKEGCTEMNALSFQQLLVCNGRIWGVLRVLLELLLIPLLWCASCVLWHVLALEYNSAFKSYHNSRQLHETQHFMYSWRTMFIRSSCCCLRLFIAHENDNTGSYLALSDHPGNLTLGSQGMCEKKKKVSTHSPFKRKSRLSKYSGNKKMQLLAVSNRLATSYSSDWAARGCRAERSAKALFHFQHGIYTNMCRHMLYTMDKGSIFVK